MKALDIKKRREELHLTQEQLASKMGVSKNTILNYEKGKVIPDSKLHLLHSILYEENHNIEVNEPRTEYQKTNTYIDLEETIEKLSTVEKTIKVAKENGEVEREKHYIFIAKLLSEQIRMMRKKDEEIEEDSEILKNLEK